MKVDGANGTIPNHLGLASTFRCNTGCPKRELHAGGKHKTFEYQLSIASTNFSIAKNEFSVARGKFSFAVPMRTQYCQY